MYCFKIISLHIFAFLLGFLTTVDKSDASKYEIENCKDWICVNKCCPKDHILRYKNETTLQCIKPSKPEVTNQIDYTKIKTPKGPSRIKTKILNCTSDRDGDCVELIDKSDDFISDNIRVFGYRCDYMIYKGGLLESLKPGCPPQKKGYCVDFCLGEKKTVQLMYLSLDEKNVDKEDVIKEEMSATGMSISAFFILLILVVYGLLPKLQNLVGLVLMAYLLTFMVALILRVVQIKVKLPEERCSILGTPAYFFLLASFFWLNIMAFDIWWTIRGSRKCRAIHRQGEKMKFLWYSLYAWGTPLALTLGIYTVYQLKLYKDLLKPSFTECYPETKSVYLYIGTPMAILIFVNLVLFLLTARELWLINQALTSPDSSNTKNNKRFKLYIKLFLIMGVTWLLELVPLNVHIVLFILVNFCNILIGVILFIIFVCKKSVFIMLCNRFNVKINYVDNLKSSQYSRSKTLSSSINCKDTKEKHDNGKCEDTDMENENLGNIYPELEIMKCP